MNNERMKGRLKWRMKGWNEEWKEERKVEMKNERKVERMNNIPELICSDSVVFKDHELEPRLSDQSLIKHGTGNCDDLSVILDQANHIIHTCQLIKKPAQIDS